MVQTAIYHTLDSPSPVTSAASTLQRRSQPPTAHSAVFFFDDFILRCIDKRTITEERDFCINGDLGGYSSDVTLTSRGERECRNWNFFRCCPIIYAVSRVSFTACYPFTTAFSDREGNKKVRGIIRNTNAV